MVIQRKAVQMVNCRFGLYYGRATNLSCKANHSPPPPANYLLSILLPHYLEENFTI